MLYQHNKLTVEHVGQHSVFFGALSSPRFRGTFTREGAGVGASDRLLAGPETMKRLAISVVRSGALLLGVLVIAGVVLSQTKLLDGQFVFFPDRELHANPADVGLEYDDVFLSTPDGVRLHGWFIPGDAKTTILWFHGNGGNISQRVDNILLVNRHLGANVFIFDYRGYGRSEGRPSEEGTYVDAEAAVEYLLSERRVAADRDLVLFGRSLGGAVAVEIATRRSVRAVILESPFTSVVAMATRTHPYVPAALVRSLVQSRYDSLAKIKDVHSPIMVLHGDRDDLIPFDIGRELFEAANEPKRFYAIEGAAHNDTYLVGGGLYFDALRQFLVEPSAKAE